MISRAEANPRGRPQCEPLLRPKKFSISCSFVENLTKLYVSTPPSANLGSAPASDFGFFYTFGIYIQRPIYNLFIILFVNANHPNCMSTVMREQNYKTNLQLNIFISGYLFVQQQTNLFIEFINLFIKQ